MFMCLHSGNFFGARDFIGKLMVGIAPSQLQQNSKNSLTSSSNKNKSVYTFFLTFVD